MCEHLPAKHSLQCPLQLQPHLCWLPANRRALTGAQHLPIKGKEPPPEPWITAKILRVTGEFASCLFVQCELRCLDSTPILIAVFSIEDSAQVAQQVIKKHVMVECCGV